MAGRGCGQVDFCFWRFWASAGLHVFAHKHSLNIPVSRGRGRVWWRGEGEGGLTTRVRQRERERERYLCRWNGRVGGTYMWVQAARSRVSGKLGASGKQKSCFSETIGAKAGWKAVTLSWLLFSPHSCKRGGGCRWQRGRSFFFSFFLAVCFVSLCKWRLLSAAGLHVCAWGDYYPVSPVRLLIFMSYREAFPAVALWEAEWSGRGDHCTAEKPRKPFWRSFLLIVSSNSKSF